MTLVFAETEKRFLFVFKWFVNGIRSQSKCSEKHFFRIHLHYLEAIQHYK